MKFYHATTKENADSICEDLIIKTGWDGYIYLCKKAEDACKFLAIRGIKNIIVFEIDLDEHDVEESFDHSEGFFKCKAYMHKGDIELNGKEWIHEYSI